MSDEHQQDPNVFCDMSHSNALDLASQISLVVKQSFREEVCTTMRSEFSRFSSAVRRDECSLPALTRVRSRRWFRCRITKHLNALEARASALECAISPGDTMMQGRNQCSTNSSHPANANAPRRKSGNETSFREASLLSFSDDSDYHAPGYSAAGACGVPRPVGERGPFFASESMPKKTIFKPVSPTELLQIKELDFLTDCLTAAVHP